MSMQAQSSLSDQNRPLVDDEPDLGDQILASLARSTEIARSPWERERVMAEWRPTTLPRTSEAGLGADGSDLGAGGSGGSDHGCRDRCSGDTDDTDPDWDAISSEIYRCLASRRTPFFVATPEFSDLDGKPTDFDDLRQRQGLDAVRRWLDPKMAGQAVTEAWEPLRRQAADDQRTHGRTLP